MSEELHHYMLPPQPGHDHGPSACGQTGTTVLLVEHVTCPQCKTILENVTLKVERDALRARVERVEDLRAEIERLRAVASALNSHERCRWHDEADALRARVERVEALADEWEAAPMPHTSDHDATRRIARLGGKREAAAALRAALTAATPDAGGSDLTAGPEDFGVKVKRVAATVDIGLVVEQGGCDTEELVAHILHAADAPAGEVTPPAEARSLLVTTCLCGEALKPGFGWHSCNARPAGEVTPPAEQRAECCASGSCEVCRPLPRGWIGWGVVEPARPTTEGGQP